MIGAPGVGKSTLIEKASQEIFGDRRLEYSVVSPDNIRLMVQPPKAKPCGAYHVSNDNEKYVWSIVGDVLERKVDKGELIIVDATHSRNKALSVYKKYSDKGYRVIGVDFRNYADIDTILKRNAQRDPHKFVPEEAIRTVHARVETLDIPTWIDVIEPDAFIDHLKDLKYDFNKFESLTFIGDIHGCKNELIRLLDANGIDPYVKNTKDAKIFIGDYFDRGYDVIGTYKLLKQLSENHWVMFLEGNHEEPLRYYKEFMASMTNWIHEWREDVLADYETKWSIIQRQDQLLLEKEDYLISQDDFFKRIKLPFKKNRLSRSEDEVNNMISMNEAKLKGFDNFEPEAIILLVDFHDKSYKQLDKLVEDMKEFPRAFGYLKSRVWSYNLPTSIIKDDRYGFHKLKRTSLRTCKEFLVSDIPYTEIIDFSKRCAQLFYADFNGQEVVATHGGIQSLPTKLTPTADLVRGVGGYEDAQQCDETFHRLHPDAIGIHGHRNLTNLPIATTDGTFNINGDVDLGVRSVQLHGDGCVELTEIKPSEETLDYFRNVQIRKAKKYNAKKLTVQEEGNGLMRMFQDHAHVDVKKLPNNVAAINFTRKAFEKGVWDNVTIKARGLFAGVDTHDNPAGPNSINIIARGYEKFFNVGERHGFEQRDIRNLGYPLLAFEKANGYLGLLSVDNRDPENPDWFIASKTTTEGDFALNLQKMILPLLSQGLMDQMIQDKVTLVFEVIEPEFDPHIEEYKNAELILLDAVQNQIFFTKLNPEEVSGYMVHFPGGEGLVPVRTKKLLKTCWNFNDYFTFVEEINSQKLLTNGGIEGIVFEDSSTPENMFKLKTDWYSFWKYMRTVKDRIANRIRKVKEGEPRVLSKSDRINLKSKLYNESHIRTFNFMVELAESDFSAYEKMSIIDVRNLMIEKMQKDK